MLLWVGINLETITNSSNNPPTKTKIKTIIDRLKVLSSFINNINTLVGISITLRSRVEEFNIIIIKTITSSKIIKVN